MLLGFILMVRDALSSEEYWQGRYRCSLIVVSHQEEVPTLLISLGMSVFRNRSEVRTIRNETSSFMFVCTRLDIRVTALPMPPSPHQSCPAYHHPQPTLYHRPIPDWHHRILITTLSPRPYLRPTGTAPTPMLLTDLARFAKVEFPGSKIPKKELWSIRTLVLESSYLARIAKSSATPHSVARHMRSRCRGRGKVFGSWTDGRDCIGNSGRLCCGVVVGGWEYI